MRGYLREHGWGIAAFFLFTAVFGVTFALYGLPLEAVAYPAGLCALLGGALVLSGILAPPAAAQGAAAAAGGRRGAAGPAAVHADGGG